MIQIQPNGCIGDSTARYPTKMEGFATIMSDMKELGEIVDDGWVLRRPVANKDG